MILFWYSVFLLLMPQITHHATQVNEKHIIRQTFSNFFVLSHTVSFFHTFSYFYNLLQTLSTSYLMIIRTIINYLFHNAKVLKQSQNQSLFISRFFYLSPIRPSILVLYILTALIAIYSLTRPWVVDTLIQINYNHH